MITFTRKQMVQLLAVSAIVLAVIGLVAWRYGVLIQRLQNAEERLRWLEPPKAMMGIDHITNPDRNNPYNPAEFALIADEKNYRRAYYSPDINTQTTPHPDWCYVPRLNQINQHRLFLFSAGGSFFTDLWGILRLKPLPRGWYDSDCIYLLVLNSQVKDVFWQGTDLMVVVSPKRQGYQVVRVTNTSSRLPQAWLLDNNHEIWEEAYR